MARRKVKLAYIMNDSARRSTYNKRKSGLVKKIKELTTLCGIEAGAVIYSPSEAHPEVYPSPEGLNQVLNRFRTMDETDQTKKMFDQEAFLHHRIEKTQDQLKRLQRDNHEKEMARVMFQAMADPRVLENMGVLELNDLGWLIDQYSVDVDRRLERLAEAKPKEEPVPLPPPPPLPQPQLQPEQPPAPAPALAPAPAPSPAPAPTTGATLTDQHGYLEMMMYQDQTDPVLAMDRFWLD